MLPFAFDGLPEESEDEVKSRAAFLSGFDPVLYDCCLQSCCCYVGPYKDCQECPICGEAHFNAADRPRKKFTYIPLIPRLVALYRNRDMAVKMRYRSSYVPSPIRHATPTRKCGKPHHLTGNGQAGKCYCPSSVNDVFDGYHYRTLCETPVTINGKKQAHTFFSHALNIALGFSTDGFTPFKRRNQSCWPLVLYNYNLPPEERFHRENVICVGVIPGPKKPHNVDSFL